MSSNVRPVLILGAARSGTKLLRRLLGAAPTCAVVPYGVPAVWTRDHEDYAHDALPRSACTDATARRIRRELRRLAQGPPDATLLVEKTSANTLRVPFVDAVFPEARFVHLVRDGVDVVESARRRWQARPGLVYLLRKALYLRGTGLRQGARYLWRRLRGLGTDTPRLWGPHYPGMADDVAERPLLEVCARQWRTCVLSALNALADLPEARVLSLRYETLVQNPSTVDYLAQFAGISEAKPMRVFYDEEVRDTFVGRGRDRLSASDQEMIRPILHAPLARLGYPALP
ncbi:MAG: sulfotransferase family protein [Salinivenus sp.]